jgi:RNA polymerase sigma-70 factor (ECF subfamily)
MPASDNEQLWAEARRQSLRLARLYVRDRDEVEDVAQEALLRAWKRRSSLRERERFFQWLATIVRNEAARSLGRRRPEPALIADRERAEDDERVLQAENRADLERGLRQLNEEDRLIVHLRYQSDLTYAGIARRLGMPEGTVKVRLHRARAKLHRALTDL